VVTSASVLRSNGSEQKRFGAAEKKRKWLSEAKTYKTIRCFLFSFVLSLFFASELKKRESTNNKKIIKNSFIKRIKVLMHQNIYFGALFQFITAFSTYFVKNCKYLS